MTVCIAAICEWQGTHHVVGASDRMLTSRDVEFEPPTMKLWIFAPNIVALAAGDASAQAQICNRTLQECTDGGITSVDEAARIYGRHFADVRRERNEITFLSPLGLDIDSWITRQQELSVTVVESLERSLTYEELEAEGIICGVDEVGPHIFVVTDPGLVDCEDSVGFAAIGIGASHADSQFMLAGYHFNESFPRSMFLTHSAKRRAEVAPAVGGATDLFTVSINGWSTAHPDVIAKLEEIYRSNVVAEKAARKKANQDTQQFVEVLIEQQKKQQGSATTTASPPAPANDDKEGISGGAEESEPED